MEKHLQYASKIYSKVTEIFNEDDDYFINPKELEKGKNFEAFIHALATLVPGLIYNKLTNEQKDSLEFNHIANHLVFDFSEK